MLALYLLAINALTFLAFYGDKRASIRKRWRVPEASLLLLALLGGTPAAWGARKWLRHKTRKTSFSVRLGMIAAVQVAGIVWLVFQHYPL